MSHVFISYAHQDYKRAEQLRTSLERSRIPVWWDPKIQIGEQFTPVIEKALIDAAAVIVLWSRSSGNSAWVIKEASLALHRHTYFPVLIEPVEPPGEFAKYNCANLSTWDSHKPHHEFDQLRRTLLSLFGSKKNEGGWKVQRLDQETLLIVLDQERHTIRYFEGSLYVDGQLRLQGAPSIIDVRSFNFEVSDGKQYFPARLDVLVTMFKGAVKRLTLEVGGTLLYQG